MVMIGGTTDMKLTRQHKISLVILALGLVALSVDRLFVLPGSVSGEEITPAEQTAAKATVEKQPASDEPNSVGENVSNRLDDLWADRQFDPCSMRDAFSVPAFWSEEGAPEKSDKPDEAARFARAHTLKAVAINANRSGVLIDDRYLALGEEIDGFRLARIGETSARFESNGLTAVLKLSEADNQKKRN